MLCEWLGWCVDVAVLQVLGSGAFLLGVGIWYLVETTFNRKG